MVAIASLLVIVTISVVVTRVATSALELTGVSRELATFQARSAYTGVGFTTEEAEAVVTHPIRRRIVLNLMLLGNAGSPASWRRSSSASSMTRHVELHSSDWVSSRLAWLCSGSRRRARG